MAFVLLLLSLPTVRAGADSLVKALPPAGYALHVAAASIDEAYRDDLAGAKTTADREVLAWRMYQTAIDTTNDNAGRFVLMGKARDEAALAGSVDIAFAAISQLNKDYQIDALTMRIQTLAACLRNMEQGADFPEVVELANALTDTAVSADKYDLANQAVAVARQSSDRSGYPTLVQYVARHAAAVKKYADAYETIRPSAEILAKTPTDPQANYTVGKFRCFVKGDWSGLLMLSLGSDAALKDLATKDLAGATTVEDQVKLGDAWWAVAEKETGAVKDHVRWQAGKWYYLSYKKLVGLEQAKVTARLNLMVYDPELRVVNLLKIVDPAKDAVKGTWKLDGALEEPAPEDGSRLSFEYLPPDEYDYQVTFSRNTGGDSVVIIAGISGHQFAFIVGGFGNTVAGIEDINRAGASQNQTAAKRSSWLTNGKKYTCLLKVRRDWISAYIDGKFVTQYRGDPSKLSTGWSMHHEGGVGLGSQSATTTFYAARIVEISGQGSDFPDATTTDAKEDTISRLWEGTGIIVSDDGLILTNHHVVRDSKTLVVVRGDQHIPAEIVAVDDKYDLALVRIKSDKKLPFLKLAPADHGNNGADVLAMGFPLLDKLGGDIKVTRGIVSSSDTKTDSGADTMIDAKINHGNSGGPILDHNGNIMAVVCLKTVTEGDEETYGIGISAGHVREFLARHKITLPTGDANEVLSSEEIARKAKPSVVCIWGAG